MLRSRSSAGSQVHRRRRPAARRQGRMCLRCSRRRRWHRARHGAQLGAGTAARSCRSSRAIERRERELLQALAEWAVRFTPRVSLEPPDAVLLEVRGSLRLFGGARRLCEQLRAELQAVGLEPQSGVDADAARVALVRAFRQGSGLPPPSALASALAPLPLACTRWPERSLQSLATMGVRTIGDCLRSAARWLCAAL